MVNKKNESKPRAPTRASQGDDLEKASVVDQVIAENLSENAASIVSQIPRAELEYLRVHSKFWFPDPEAPPPSLSPFHARLRATSEASAGELTKALKRIRPKRLTKDEAEAFWRLEVVDHATFAFERTEAGYLEAVRCLFLFEDVSDLEIVYVYGERP